MMSSPRGAPQYSVLVLGSTQAGKSAFIEHVRSYADPDYVIDKSLLSDGITSKSDTTIPFLIESNLPSYEAYQKKTGETFDLSNLATLYKDDEDYRDVLLSNASAVSMRLVPQDPVVLSQSTEFRLLDTPGLNGTQGKDSEHVVSIVNEIISTRSFNLIVVVISSKSPLTEEKQLALEYFAYVLWGLHSRIIFLHTHVDYSKSHHSNTSHHLDMSMRSKAISKMFRRHDGESVFDEFNITEYPCFNIDLTTRNRPIVQCMIQNTIRQILTMATTPPVILDTSNRNIERIHAITYPSEFSQEQRKNLKATLRRNLAKPKYSVLILGKTQAGKSTLIEHIKNYANLSYTIDKLLLGNDNFSETESTQPFYVESNLPAYEVYRKDTGEVIDLGDLPSKFDDEEDYRDILFSREQDVGLRLAPQDPNSPSDNIEFRLLDSLGLTNTDENDSNHAAIIIDKLILVQTFNLIIITESYKNLLTQEQQLDLDYFANVFKGLHSRIMFLHTHVDYTNIHPTNTTHYLNMELKNKALSKIFRRFNNESPFDKDNFRVYPSLTIDLVSNKQPIINCLIQNTIREILKIATQPAVPFDTSIQNIERIRAIPYPTHFTDDQLKHAKARLQADADKFGEELAEVRVEEEVQAKNSAEDVQTENSVVEVQAEKPVEEVQAEKPVKEASSYDFLLDLLCFFRRRRKSGEEEENLVGGGAGGDHSQYEAHHGGIPPLIPIAPIGDLDEVIVEDKDHPGAPNNNNDFPGGPSGNGSVVPPVGGGSNSHLPSVIGGVVSGAIIGGAIASHKKKDEKETVTHGHIAPVPVPGGPNSDNSTNQPSGSGGVLPVGGSSSSSSTETPHHHGKDILIGGAATGKRNNSSDSLSKTTRTTAKTTVTTTKNGDRIFTTIGSGGCTVVTECTETGAARHIITGVIPGQTTVCTITQRTETGEVILVPVDEPEGDCRKVVTELSENGQIHYIIGGIIAGTITKTQITHKLSIMRYERADASAAIPSAAVGTVMFSKFKMLAAGDVNIENTAYSHVEETKDPMSCRTLKWMKTEFQWKREAGMLQHLKSDRYIADLYILYSLPTFAEYRYVSVLGSFSRTLESHMLTQKINSLQILQLALALSDALRWCHEHHVVHLNVRPSSFYLDGVPSVDGSMRVAS